LASALRRIPAISVHAKASSRFGSPGLKSTAAMAGVRTLVDPSVQGNLDKVHALPVLETARPRDLPVVFLREIAQDLSCPPGVEREILSSSSFMSAETSAKRGVLN
jgi:hypothetical protein